jgi:tetratricopeptide (TPR) repeat protein
MALERTKYLRELRRRVVEYFDLEELKIIASDMALDWDELPGERKTAKSQALIRHLAHCGRLADLVALLCEERPDVDWPDVPPSDRQAEDAESLTPEGMHEAYAPTYVDGDVGGNVIGGSQNIVTIITEGIGERQFSRAQSDSCNERGRDRIRKYGEEMARHGVWDWHPLGQAMEYYVDAIKHDPQNQHPWINLAYVYHLIGARQKALECLARAFELATPGPNHPGRHYKRVEAAVGRGSYLSGGRVARPETPDWFREAYERFL